MGREFGTIVSLTFLAIIMFLILNNYKAAVAVLGGAANSTLAGINELQTGGFHTVGG